MYLRFQGPTNLPKLFIQTARLNKCLIVCCIVMSSLPSLSSGHAGLTRGAVPLALGRGADSDAGVVEPLVRALKEDNNCCELW